MTTVGPAVAFPAGSSELRLFVRCHDRLLALEASWIERVLLTDEAEPPLSPAVLGVSMRMPAGFVGVLTVDTSTWAAWDIAMLLGQPPAQSAWILTRLRHRGALLPIALRTDRCLHVGPLVARRQTALPAGLLHARRGVVRAAFPSELLRLGHRAETPIGLDLDLTRLLTAEELDFSQELLARA